MNNFIVLISPRIDPTSNWFRVPLSILAVARILAKDGYRVKLIDAMAKNDYEKDILAALRDNPICIGISSMTGYQIYNGLKIAQLIKEHNPDIPIVWGGWHPSLEPGTTITNPYVDVVVRGQGEITMLEVVRRLQNNTSLEGVLGINYKISNQIFNNQDRPSEDINKFPTMPYDTVCVEEYILNTDVAERTINYISSQGCPYRCGFCADSTLYKRRWNGLDAERVVEELAYLNKEYKINGFFLDDNNFFVNKQRVESIGKGIIERRLNIKLGKVNGHPRDLLGYNDDFWEFLRRAGLSSILIGAESGSQRILDMIKKDITVDDIIRLAKVCKEHDIKIYYSFMLGFPGQPYTELFETLELIDKIKSIDDRCNILVFYYTPYPGTPLFDIALKYGLKPAASLQEWASFNLYTINTPWLDKKYQKLIKRVTKFYLPFAYPDNLLKSKIKKSRLRFIYNALHKIAYFQVGYLRSRQTILPIDYFIYNFLYTLKRLFLFGCEKLNRSK